MSIDRTRHCGQVPALDKVLAEQPHLVQAALAPALGQLAFVHLLDDVLTVVRDGAPVRFKITRQHDRWVGFRKKLDERLDVGLERSNVTRRLLGRLLLVLDGLDPLGHELVERGVRVRDRGPPVGGEDGLQLRNLGILELDGLFENRRPPRLPEQLGDVLVDDEPLPYLAERAAEEAVEVLDLKEHIFELLGVLGGEIPDLLPAREQFLLEQGLLHGSGVGGLVLRTAAAASDPIGVLLAPDGPPVAPALFAVVPPQPDRLAPHRR